MTDQEPADPRALADSLVDALLEEHLGGEAPPGRARAIAQAARSAPADFAADFAAVWRDTQRSDRRRRPPLAAAAVLLVGTAVVVGTALLQHTAGCTAENAGARAATAPQGQGQDSKPRPNAASAFFPLQVGSVWEYRDVIGEQQTAHTVRACVAVPVGDDLVVQLADCSDGDVAFTFWSSDARGIRRHASLGTRDDPQFVAAGDCIELPSPIGAQATWPVERVPERSRPGAGVMVGLGGRPGGGVPGGGVPGGGVPGAGAGGAGKPGGGGGGFARAGARPQAPEPQRGTATLLGLDEELRLGEQTWRCAHVRVVIDGTPDQLVEESWYARGVGLVRRTSRSGDGPETVRELVRYAPAQPLPDRDTLLAASVGDAAKSARWIELPASEETAWTLRASVAVVKAADATRSYAVVGDQVLVVGAEELVGFRRLARAEDFDSRMHGLFPQRVTHGLCRLAVRLLAGEVGADVVPGPRSGSISINPGSCRGQLQMRLRSVHGAEQAVEAHVELRGSEPVDVHIVER